MLVTVGTMSSGFCLKPSTCSTVTQDAAAHAGRDAPDDASAERDAEPDGRIGRSNQRSPVAAKVRRQSCLLELNTPAMILLMEETKYAR